MMMEYRSICDAEKLFSLGIVPTGHSSDRAVHLRVNVCPSGTPQKNPLLQLPRGRDYSRGTTSYLSATCMADLFEYANLSRLGAAYRGYSSMITGAGFRHSLLSFLFGVKLKDVFRINVPAPLIIRLLSVGLFYSYSFLSSLFLYLNASIAPAFCSVKWNIVIYCYE